MIYSNCHTAPQGQAGLEAGRQVLSFNSRAYAPRPQPWSLCSSQTDQQSGLKGRGDEDGRGSVGCGAGKLNWEPAFAEPSDLQPQNKYPCSTAYIPTGHQPPDLSAINIVIRKQDSY